MDIKELPAVGRIQGILYTEGKDRKSSKVVLQYLDQSEAYHSVEIPLLDALYLLSLLKGLQLELGIPFPDDPRAPQ